MVVFLIILVFFAVCAGCYVYSLVDEYREGKRREKERQTNRKQCPKCGDTHDNTIYYNKEYYCPKCIIAEAKSRGIMVGKE